MHDREAFDEPGSPLRLRGTEGDVDQRCELLKRVFLWLNLCVERDTNTTHMAPCTNSALQTLNELLQPARLRFCLTTDIECSQGQGVSEVRAHWPCLRQYEVGNYCSMVRVICPVHHRFVLQTVRAIHPIRPRLNYL